MKRSFATQMTALACALSMASCTYTKTFGYTPQYQVQVTDEEPEVATAEARRLLASATTIAFYAPDRCVNTSDKAEEEKQFRASCGVLLTYLELEAKKAGYDVVSWQNVRSDIGSRGRTLDYARELKVDVLFEINEISDEKIHPDTNVNRSLSFFDRTDHGDVPFNPSPGVLQRCYNWSTHHDQMPTFGDVATIDIKATSVADGRSRWQYRKSKVFRDEAAAPSERFVGRTQPNKLGNTLGGVGTVLLLLGATFAGVDAALANTADPVTGVPKDKVFGSTPYYAMGIGAALLAGGAVIMITQGQRKPTADEVMCDDKHVPVNGLFEGGSQPQPTVVYTGTQNGQATFAENRAQADTVDKARMQKEIHESVQEFVQVLDDVKKNAPPPPPPAPAAPAPAPAPTP